MIRAAKHIACTLALVAVVPVAGAAAWQWEPSIGFEERYDDNVRLQAEDADAVHASRIAGSMAVTRETEIASVQGIARIDYIHYPSGDVDIGGQSNQLVRIESLRRGERSRIDFDASLRRDSLLRTVEAFDQPDEVEVDPNEDVDIGIVDVNVRRTRLIVQPGWRYDVSPRHAMGLTYRLNDVRYGEARSVGLSEFTDHTFVAYSDYGLTELDRLRSRIEISSYSASRLDREYLTYALVEGIEHAFSPIMSGGAEIGIHRTEFDTATDDGSDDGVIVRLFGERDLGLTRFSGRIGRRLFPSGGGDVVRSNELTFNMVHRASERSSLGLRTRLFENRSLRDDNPSVNRRYFSIEPRFSWNMTREWTVGASYRYRRQKRDTDENSAESNAVFLSVYYSLPREVD